MIVSLPEATHKNTISFNQRILGLSESPDQETGFRSQNTEAIGRPVSFQSLYLPLLQKVYIVYM